MQNTDEKKSASGPLSGIRVLNIGTSIVGPWAASLLSYLGADAIKVERPNGEFIRFLHPMQKGISTCYTTSNNDQLSSELDIKQPEEYAAAERLAEQADVIIENFRPGVSDRIGLGFEKTRKKNPGLVFASSSSWGDVGPMRDRAALDPHVQAFSGFGSLNGPEGDEPEMLRFVHMDPAGAAVVAGLCLLGLIHRERFGGACHVKTSHFAMGIAMQMNRAAETLLAGEPTGPLGSASSSSAPNQCFRMLDGEYIALACDTQAQWEALCQAIGAEALVGDARFATNVDRVNHREVLAELLGAIIETKPKRWWVVQLEKAGVPHGFSLDFEQIRHHQQIVENEFLTSVHAPHTGSLFVGGLPWQFAETPARINPRIAVPGEHTEQVIENGFGEALSREQAESPDDASTPPLDGLRVVDATQGYAGPYLGLLLAEAGADVIKVEPPEGDWARQLAPVTPTGNSALFESFNRNKRSVFLDLEKPDDCEEFRALTRDAAVVLEDWGPGVAEQRGLGHDLLSGENPGLVYLALSKFGEKGPMRNLPASEIIIQAMTGYLRLLGKPGDPPLRVGSDMVATCAGSVAFIGVLAALYHRHKTGRGQRVACSELGSMMCLRTQGWAALTNPDEWLGDSYCTNETDHPHRGYSTRDRPVYMSPSPHLTKEDFVSMLKELGAAEDMLGNPEFDENWWFTFGMGYLSREAKPIWEKHTKKMTAREVLDIVERYKNVWAVEFADLGALMAHPQVEAIDLVDEAEGSRYVRAPWRVPWELPEVRKASALSQS